MTDNEQNKELEHDEEEEKLHDEPKVALSPKIKIIVITIIVFLLILGLGGFLRHLKKTQQEQTKQVEAQLKEPAQSLVDMDGFIVNLNTEGKSVSFLKLKIKLELSDAKDKATLEEKMPKIRDTFQLYLRELRPADMQGSVGLYRLREELLLRVNKLVYPVQIEDLLFDEVLVQ